MDENEVIQDDGNEGNANPDPVEGQQDAAVPTADQQPTETDGEDGDLPEEVSARTKEQFEKLKKNNQELAEKLKKYETSDYGESVFDYLSGQVPSESKQGAMPQAKDYSNLNQRQVENIVDRFIEPDGTVNIAAMNKALLDADRMAKEANKRATAAVQQVRQSEERRQIQEAHAKFPWLDPKSENFDPQGYELVRDRILRNMVQSKSQTVAEVAEDISRFYKPNADAKAEQTKAVEDYKRKQTEKAASGAVSSGRTAPRVDTSYEDLRDRTIRGDQDAIDARLEAATKG